MGIEIVRVKSIPSSLFPMADKTVFLVEHPSLSLLIGDDRCRRPGRDGTLSAIDIRG